MKCSTYSINHTIIHEKFSNNLTIVSPKSQQAEERLLIIEEQRRMDEEKLKMKKEQEKRLKAEQKMILGKGNTRPKLSFSIKPGLS